MQRIVSVGALKNKRDALVRIGGGYADAVSRELTEHGLLLNCDKICTRCKKCVLKGAKKKKVVCVDDEAAEGEPEQPDESEGGEEGAEDEDEVEEQDDGIDDDNGDENSEKKAKKTEDGIPTFALVLTFINHSLLILCLALSPFPDLSLTHPIMPLTIS